MKKRSFLAMMMALVMALAFALTGCGSSGGSGSGDTNGDAIPFVIGTVETDDSITAQVMAEFEEYVETETNGAVDVQVNNNGVLGGEREILEGVELGTIQLALPGSSMFDQYDKKFSILDVPFLFPNYQAMQNAWAGEFGETYTAWLDEIGFECYGLVTLGMRGMANNKHEIRTPDDLKGLKMRVMESETYVNLFNALGANAITMSYSEVYTGLQQGTIDGQDNPPQYNIEAGFYELQPYYTRTNHVVSKELYITSKAFMESLDPEIRQVIETGLRDAAKKHSEMQIEAEEGFVQQMKDADINVIELTDDELKAFQDKVAFMWDDMREIVGEDVFNQALAGSEE